MGGTIDSPDDDLRFPLESEALSDAADSCVPDSQEDCRDLLPGRMAVFFIRQFARCYSSESALGCGLGPFIAN